MNLPDRQLRPLTGLRFVAAAYVAFHHFAYLSGVYPTNQGINFLLGLGYISVNFFFILSGFVLAWNYIDDAGGFRVSRRTFWIARFARLYPAYALALLFALPRFIELASRGGAPAPGALPLDNPWVVFGTALTTPLLLQDWFGLVAWNTVGWSLSAEAFFYLTFPYIAPRIGRATKSQLALLACICSLVPIGLAWVMFGGTLQGGHSASWYKFTTFAEAFFYASPLIHWPEFILGVIIGRWFQQRSLAGKQSNWKPSYDYIAASGTLVLLCVFGLLPGPIFSVMMSPVFGWLIFALAHSRSRLALSLSARSLLLLGNASYSIYLFHETAIHTLVNAGRTFRTEWILSWPAFGLGFYLIAALTIAVYAWIEEPTRDWIRLRLIRRTA